MTNRKIDISSMIDEIRKTTPARREQGYGTASASTAYIDDLARVECAGLTARRARFDGEIGVDRDPIVLARGDGEFLWDAEGNPYIDMGACFAVAAYGHANPELVDALDAQAHKLMHGMGDVYPTDTKVSFLKALAQIAPGNLSGALLSQSGAEAVETAMKMAQMATKRSRFIAFESSYHGLSYGALSVTGHQDSFKQPFAARICQQTTHVPYANCLHCAFSQKPESCEFACIRHIERILRSPASGTTDVAAVIVEPIQGRGGDVVPPKGWLRALRDMCTRNDVLLIADEIYTGFGRTGECFACNAEGVVPDIMCLGKAMTGGFPLSAAIATPEVLAKWPLNTTEAIHTSTFLGNPMGCAVGLKAIEILQRDALPDRAKREGDYLLGQFKRLQSLFPNRIADARGRGLMVALEFATPKLEPLTDIALKLVDDMRDRGFILLPSGPHGNVISLAPPLIIAHECLAFFVEQLEASLSEIC